MWIQGCKPCPFCGETCMFEIGTEQYGCRVVTQNIWIECNGCGAKGPVRYDSTLDEAAIKLWNTRPV